MISELFIDKEWLKGLAAESAVALGHPLKAFLICPVRGHSPEELAELVDWLEKDCGFVIHWPPRDTPQNDPTGLNICRVSTNVIRTAGIVFFFWDGKSQGSLFDLGIAFALDKPIIPLSMPPATDGKSFQNMVATWFRESWGTYD